MLNTLLFESIVQHLNASPSNAVVVATYTRSTVYRQKQLELFSAPTREGETGVYVRAGKRREYVFPQYVHLAHDRKVVR